MFELTQFIQSETNRMQTECHSLVHHLIELLNLPNWTMNVHLFIGISASQMPMMLKSVLIPGYLLKVTAIYIDRR